MDVLREILLPKLEGIRKSGGSYMARCPAHEDGKASLSITEGKDQPVVLNCLAGETRVITREGTKSLAEMAGGTYELLVPSLHGGPPVWQKSPVSSFGVQRLMRLTLQRFNAEKVIHATAEHRWFAQRRNSATVKEIVTSDLQPGMRLKAITPRQRRTGQISSFGVAHGFTYGDGNLRGRGLGSQASFCGAKDTALLSYFPHMEPYAAGENVLRITGLPKFFKQVPPIDEAPAYLFGWLAGYFAADGSIEGPDGPAVISSASRESLEFVRDVATRLGIVTYPIQEQWRRGVGEEPSALYKVTLRPLDLPEEFFILPAHRQRWSERAPATSYDTWRVVSAEMSDRVEEVYCATVDGVHAFALEDNILTGNCHAGCRPEDVLAKLGLTWETLCNPREQDRLRGEWTPHGEALAVYDYTDEAGKLLFQVLRTVDKQFPQRVPDRTRKSGWRWSLGDTRRVLYRLPKILEAVADGEHIWVCEGEKDVHALEAAGVTATCNPGGAGKWRPEFAEFLRDAIVFIVADKDKPGQAHARAVAASLDGIAAAVEIREAPDPHKDAAAHFAAGLGLADFEVTWESGEPRTDLAPDLYEFLAVEDPGYDWVIPGLLERGDRLIWTGFEGLGKALALDTPIPTPKGWTTMGELSVGDEVFGADGRPARVAMATPVMTGHACYRVTFSDGAEIVADADHLWLTETLAAREAYQKYLHKAEGAPRKRGTDQKHKRRHFPEVFTTEQIRDTLMARNGHAVNHSVKTCEPLQYPAQELPVAPYTLGAWLGDGTSRTSQITCGDEDTELLEYIRADGYAVGHTARMVYHVSNRPERDRRIAEGRRLVESGMGLIAAAAHVGVGRDCLGQSTRKTGQRATLQDAGVPPLGRYLTLQELLAQTGVLGNKHIPRTYLEASVTQRLALLQGLMDTDGTVSAHGAAGGRGSGMAACEFSVTSERLARDVHELLAGLGIKVTFRSGPAVLDGRRVGTRYRLTFQTDLPVFKLRRKAERLVQLRTRRAKLRYIKAVEPVDSVPVRCIRVDNADHMFLAGRECIPTHNSVITRQLAICAAAGIHPFDNHRIEPRRVLFVDCENPERKSRRHFRSLERTARENGFPVPEGAFRIIQRPEGVDLTREEDAAWLLERVTAHMPDLLVIGPFYRLHAADANEEQAARTVVAALDAARLKADCALITEAHAGHGAGGGYSRSVRPIGSSLLLRWPEFGYGISPHPDAEVDDGGRCRWVEVKPWRGPREEREWPRELVWGTHEMDWPWIPGTPFNHPKKKGQAA